MTNAEGTTRPGHGLALALAFLSGGAAVWAFLTWKPAARPDRPRDVAAVRSDDQTDDPSAGQDQKKTPQRVTPASPTRPDKTSAAPDAGASSTDLAATPSQATASLAPSNGRSDRSELAAGGSGAEGTARDLKGPLRGVLEPAAGGFVKLALATPLPVAFVDVKPGDRVEKGWQVFSHWESPERLHAMKNELERAKKQLELAQIRAKQADQTLARLEKLGTNVTPQEVQDAQAAAALRRGEVEAAELTVTETQNRFVAMEFEFKQAFVTTPIEGIVASVDVVQGERRQVGGAFRGVTVFNPKQLSCRGAVSPQTALRLKKNLLAGSVSATIECLEVRRPATLAAVGAMADPVTGLVPIWLDVPNEDETLISGVPAVIRWDKSPENLP